MHLNLCLFLSRRQWHRGDSTQSEVRDACVPVSTVLMRLLFRPREVFLPLPSSWAPISRPSYKPWLNERDDREVFFASIQKFDGEPLTDSSLAEKSDILPLGILLLL